MKGDMYSGIVYWGRKNGPRFSENEFKLISENIRRIILTRKGERVGNPDFGSNVKSFLFMPGMYASDVAEEVKRSVELFEPRVRVNECTLRSTGQDDIISILLSVTIITEDGTKDTDIEVKV